MPTGSLHAALLVFLTVLPAGCGDAKRATPDPGELASETAAAEVIPDAPSRDESGSDAIPDARREDDIAPPSCLPIDPSPPPSPTSDYALDGWAWGDRTLVLDAPDAAPQDGWLHPVVLVVGGVRHLWATRKVGLEHVLWHGTWAAGSAPADLTPVTGLEGDAGYATLLVDGGAFRLWYGSGTLRTATSADGVTFATAPGVALGTGPAGAFDAWSVLLPTVVREGAGFTLWYTGFDGQRYAIGRATSPDGLAFTREPGVPVLTVGAADAFDNAAVAQPMVLRAPPGMGLPTYLLWYGGYDTSKTTPGPYRVGHATSTDGVTWDRKGVALDLAPSGFEAWSTRDPWVWREGGEDGNEATWHLAYAALGDDGRYRLFHAASPVCAGAQEP